MAILELTVTLEYLGQQVINRFHYVHSGTPAVVTPTFGLLEATGYGHATGSPSVFPSGTLANEHRILLHEASQFVSAYARNLYNVTDFYEVPYPVRPLGGNTGEALAPYNAVGLFSSRSRTDIRRGMKRFAGISEGQVSSGGNLSAGTIAQATIIANKMGATLTYDDEGNTLTYVPCILGLEKYTTPSGKTAYRPYATEAIQLTHIATGIDWSVYPQLRSQVSRQYGRGA